MDMTGSIDSSIPAEELYFEWLCDIIEDSKDENIYLPDFVKMLRKLYETKFYWVIDRDISRAHDGLYMRIRFEEDTGVSRYELDDQLVEDCTVFEMLVALSRRLEYDLLRVLRYGDRTGKWFWMMIKNLGLDECDNYNYFSTDVEDILEKFMNREYFEDGTEGALFHSFSGKANFRTTEIWRQADIWIVENIEDEYEI